MSDIINNIQAIHSQEERYSKLELIYHDKKELQKIEQTLQLTANKTTLSPSITNIKEGDDKGFVCVEFHDDYDQESDDYFNKVIKTLKISHCD